MIKSMIDFAFYFCCSCLSALSFFFVSPVSAAQHSPRVVVERPEKLDLSVSVDGVTAAFRGRKLYVEIRHSRGIGRAKLTLKDLSLKQKVQASASSSSSSSSVQVEVRFLNFIMLEGFTVGSGSGSGSGSGEIYSLQNSRGKKRRFLLNVPADARSATIDLAWVDAYRH